MRLIAPCLTSKDDALFTSYAFKYPESGMLDVYTKKEEIRVLSFNPKDRYSSRYNFYTGTKADPILYHWVRNMTHSYERQLLILDNTGESIYALLGIKLKPGESYYTKSLTGFLREYKRA